MNKTKTRVTFDGRPCQIIWNDPAAGQIRIQYRPNKEEPWMQVLTLSRSDVRFGWSNQELDTLED